MVDTTDWRAIFEATYSTAESAVQEQVWREAFGAEYPEGIDPYSYVTASELQRIAEDVHLEPGDRLVDLGCGRGGAGLWVAAATGARLTGVDIAEAALEAARSRAARVGLSAEFRRGEFEATGLEDGSADAVMSIDALLFTPSKAAALRELRRVLRDGGRLVFTTWDYHAQPAGRPPQVPDHRPLLESAGFEVLAYDDAADWRRYAEATNAGLLARSRDLAAESGEDPDEVQAGIVEMAATYETMTRRIFAVAQAVARP